MGKLKEWDFSFFTAMVVILASGILAIWSLSPDLVVGLSTPKFLILAASTSFPVGAINGFLLRLYMWDKEIAQPAFIVAASAPTTFIFGIPLLLSVFLDLGIQRFVGAGILSQLVWIFWLLRLHDSKKKKYLQQCREKKEND